MSSMLDSMIERIETQARTDDPDALIQASKLIEQYPAEAKAWALRAYIHGREGNYAEAIDDLTQAVNVCPIEEPCLLCNRGRYYVNLGGYQCAIDDFTRGLDVCDLHSYDYYREEFYFFRAYAFLKLGDKVAAYKDLSKVRDDFTVWIDKLCTKQELLTQCSTDK